MYITMKCYITNLLKIFTETNNIILHALYVNYV